MSSLPRLKPQDSYNPLDDMEDVLESTGYAFTRDTFNRLSFICESKCARYTVVVEWHDDFRAARCSIVIRETQALPRPVLERAADNANEAGWHGFFVVDGVGHMIFKTLVPLQSDDPVEAIAAIEEKIDSGIEEADRLYVSLGLDGQDNGADSLFPEDDDRRVETMSLMFSDIKGHA